MGKISSVKQWFAVCAVVFLISPVLAPAAQAKESVLDSETGEKEPLPAAPAILPMPLLNIPVIRNSKIMGSLIIEIRLDVSSDEAMQALNLKQSQLSADYAETLGKWAASFQDPRGAANVIAIKNLLQKVTNEVLGSSDAIVLMQSALLRRLK